MQKRSIVAALAVTAGLVITGTTGAVAGSLIGSSDIRDNSVRSIDLKDGKAVGTADLKPGLNTLVHRTGEDGTDGQDGADGRDGLDGAKYRTATYLNGGGGSATVACDDDPEVSQQYTAISGGVQGSESGVSEKQDGFLVSSSFPGRMNWETGTPKADRLDGWIVFGNSQYTDTLVVWALCVPNTDIPVENTDIDN